MRAALESTSVVSCVAYQCALRLGLICFACRSPTVDCGGVEIGGFAFSFDPIGRVLNDEAGYEHKYSDHGEEDEAHSQLVKSRLVSSL